MVQWRQQDCSAISLTHQVTLPGDSSNLLLILNWIKLLDFLYLRIGNKEVKLSSTGIILKYFMSLPLLDSEWGISI